MARPALWAVMSLLAAGVAAWSWRFILSPEFVAAEGWTHHFTAFPLATYLHFGLAPVALLVGCFQFWPWLRSAYPHLHRALGYAYVITVWLAGAAALPLAVTTRSGTVAATGFLLLAMAWLFTTTLALLMAWRGDVQRHRRWMTRSFALAFAAVTLRLYLMAFSGLAGWDTEIVYPAAAWACWVGNLLVAEWLMRREPRL